MATRAELEELRRLEELEAKARSQDLGEIRKDKQAALANLYAGQDVSQMGSFMRGLGGAKSALDVAAMGLKGMFTDLSPEDRALLEQGKAFREQAGLAGSVGGIGGELALTAAPAVRGAQALQAAGRALPRALGVFRGSLPSNIASGAAVSAAMTPEDRGQAALGGGLGAGAGEVAGRVLTKTLGGAMSGSVTPEARTLIQQGVNVPMWKATENKIVRDIAERARVLPVAGSVVREQERAAIEGFNKLISQRATPPSPVLDDAGNVLRWETKPVREVGSDAVNTLKQRFNESYDALYKGRGIPVDDAYTQEVASILSNTQSYFPRIAGDVAAAVKQADDILRSGTGTKVTRTGGGVVGAGPVSSRMKAPVITTEELGNAATKPESVKQAIDSLETRITSAYKRGDAESAEALKEVRSAIENLRMRGLPPEVASEGAAINRAYATFKQLERATGSIGAQTQGVTTPRQMLSAIKAADRSPGKSKFARGTALNQEDVLRAEQVLGSRLPEVGPGTAEKLAPLMFFGAPMMLGDLGATSLLGTQTGQRFLQGGLPGQSFMRRYGTEYLVPALRGYGMAVGN